MIRKEAYKWRPRMDKPMTAARKRALEAVERGEVTNTFTAKGNVFKVPAGVSPRICRELQADRLIEDAREPGKRMGAYAAHFKQRLTARGRTALDDHGSGE